jgi:replication factor C large subunit
MLEKDNSMWTDKYKPKSLKEFVNQREAIDIFLKWIRTWKPGKALLFYGPPGTGKTSLLEVYARENKMELIQMNASDFRSASQIQEVLGQSMMQSSLFKKSKIFFIDEIDGLAGREDSGGVGEIIKVIKESRFPIILTANNPYDSKLRSLRQYCELVQFRKIHVYDMEKRLGQICENEKIKVDAGVLRQLADRSKGDLRSAISDLETASSGKEIVRLEDLDELGFRERETNIFDSMKIIFKTKNVQTAKQAINNVDKDPDEIFWWIENNIASEYESPEEIARAFDILSKADLFRVRTSFRQNWRLKGYMIDLMTGGVAVSKKEMYRKFTRYQYPSNIIALGRTKESRKEMRELLSKLSGQLHCSSRKLRAQYLPFLRIMIKNKKLSKEFASSLNLTKDEMKALA